MTPVCGCGVLALRAYRRLAAPVRARRRCLFAVSCSHHVESVLRTNGLRPAWRALRDRLAQCRPGYVFVLTPTNAGGIAGRDGSVGVDASASAGCPGGVAGMEGPAMRCVDGSLVPVAELSAVVRAEWEAVESCLAGDR